MDSEADLRRQELGRRIEREITRVTQWALNPAAEEPIGASPVLIEEVKAIVDRLMTGHSESLDSSKASGELPLNRAQAQDLMDTLESGREEIAYVKLRCGGPFVSSKEIWRNNDGTFTVMHSIDGSERTFSRQGLMEGLIGGDLWFPERR